MNSSIHFTAEDYQRLRQTYRHWWQGELHRPIVPVVTTGHTSSRPASPHPRLSFGNAWDFSISPEQFVDAHDAFLSTCRWHSEGFPFWSLDSFGPGVLAAFLGCTPESRPDTVWFHAPARNLPLSELHFEPDEQNPYFRRVMNVYEAALEKWSGQVVTGMVDLGGVMDVLASFRGSENLLLDLYDDPEEVLRCIKEVQAMWFYYYDKINALLKPHAQGYSQWFSMYSEEPSYILQSDFSYMISPDMFRTFVAPELASSAARLPHTLYHMDGIGQIPHLDQLLAIDGIKAIQWVPGAGEPSQRNWDELLSRILASGKKLISLAHQPDNTPISLARDPGQLYFDCREFGPGAWDQARSYGEKLGVAIRIDPLQHKE